MEAAFRRCGFKFEDQKVVIKLQILAESLSVTPDWAAYQYEAFMSSRDYRKLVRIEDIDAFEIFAEQEVRKMTSSVASKSRIQKSQRPRHSLAVLADNTNIEPEKKKDFLGSLKTPLKRQHSAVEAVVSEENTGNQVLFSLNSHLSFPPTSQAKEKGRVRLALDLIQYGISVSTNQAFMVDSLLDKASYLEQRILKVASAIEASLGCSIDNPVDAPGQGSRWFVGRICCDGDGRLNTDSVLLEGSIKHSQGHRVHLDLSKAGVYRLFPGQVVAVEGVNPNGTKLTATRIMSSFRNKQAPPPGQQREVSMLIAAGPFSFAENLVCEPLQKLLRYCEQSKPDLLLLLGPFVDAEHNLISKGLADVTFEDAFEQYVLEHLRDMDTDTEIIMIPSIRDAHHIPVFPQPAFIGPEMRQTTFLSNPATFSVQGVTIGVSTADILRAVSGQELEKGSANCDRLTALASHVLDQQSYYPLFPPAPGTALDSTLAGSLELPITPHILLLPSDLNSFAKIVPAAVDENSSVVCINPGRLVKGSKTGTYAHVRLALPRLQENERLEKVCQVDIKTL